MYNMRIRGGLSHYTSTNILFEGLFYRTENCRKTTCVRSERRRKISLISKYSVFIVGTRQINSIFMSKKVFRPPYKWVCYIRSGWRSFPHFFYSGINLHFLHRFQNLKLTYCWKFTYNQDSVCFFKVKTIFKSWHVYYSFSQRGLNIYSWRNEECFCKDFKNHSSN